MPGYDVLTAAVSAEAAARTLARSCARVASHTGLTIADHLAMAPVAWGIADAARSAARCWGSTLSNAGKPGPAAAARAAVTWLGDTVTAADEAWQALGVICRQLGDDPQAVSSHGRRRLLEAARSADRKIRALSAAWSAAGPATVTGVRYGTHLAAIAGHVAEALRHWSTLIQSVCTEHDIPGARAVAEALDTAASRAGRAAVCLRSAWNQL